MKRSTKIVAGVAAATVLLVAAGTGGAVAGKMITSAQIKDGTIKSVDLSDGVNNKLDKTGEKGDTGPAGADGATGPAGAVGPAGPAGAPGANGNNGSNGTDGLLGAVYRVANYVNGGTSSATVACADTDAVSDNYTAIAGGVQGSVSNTHPTDGTENADSFAVTSSFPGRMNWTTGEPKTGRLDGWIVFSNAKHTDTLRVWALCVPNTSIPTVVTDY